MNLTYTTKFTTKQFTQLGLSAVLLGMAAGSAHAYDFSHINVNNINTEDQAVNALKSAGVDIPADSELTKFTGGSPVNLTFPYTTPSGVEKTVTYTFTDPAGARAQALVMVHDIQNFQKHGGHVDVNSIIGTFTLQGKPVQFTATGNDKNANNIVLASKDIPALNGTFKSQAELQKYVNAKRADIVEQSNIGGFGKTGGPVSHEAQMSYYDSTLDANGVAAGNVTGLANKSRFISNFRFANYSNNTGSTQLYTLSLGYNWELGNGWGLLFNLPLTYLDLNNGNSAYRVSMGTGLRIPASKLLNISAVQWDIIPLFRLGGVGLGDQLWNNTSVAYSGGVQSNVGASLGAGFSAVVQNQYTYNTDAAQFTLGGITPADQNVHVYRNGIQLIKDLDAQLFGKTVSTSFSFADVRFDYSNNLVKFDNQQEFGFNVGLKGNGVAANVARLNLTYTNASGYDDAIAFNLGGSF